MKKEMILKIITVIIIGMMLCTMTTSVFAESSDDFWEDVEIEGEEETETIPTDGEGTPTPPVEEIPKQEESKGNNYSTDLPYAGTAENTIMVVVVTALAIVAVYAYKKMKYYTNI